MRYAGLTTSDIMELNMRYLIHPDIYRIYTKKVSIGYPTRDSWYLKRIHLLDVEDEGFPIDYG